MALRLLYGTVEETREWIGRPLPARIGADEATVADFRRKMEVHGFSCDLHTNRSAAKAAGYQDVVAPVTMLRPLSTQAYWRAGDVLTDEPYVPGPPLFEHVPAPGSAVIVVGVDTTYHAPVYPGDRIASTSTLVSVTPKTTSVGDGLILEVRTDYTRLDDGELCGRSY